MDFSNDRFTERQRGILLMASYFFIQEQGGVLVPLFKSGHEAIRAFFDR